MVTTIGVLLAVPITDIRELSDPIVLAVTFPKETSFGQLPIWSYLGAHSIKPSTQTRSEARYIKPITSENRDEVRLSHSTVSVSSAVVKGLNLENVSERAAFLPVNVVRKT